MSIILGIDCSSKTIGYSVLEIIDNKIQFISTNHLKPIKSDSIIERLAHTRDQINLIINNIKPDYIGIEEIISFMKGSSTAKTIITLTSFNRMIGLCAFDYLKRAPELFNVMSIRHGIKLNKIFPAKEDIPYVLEHHLNIKFPFIYNKKQQIKEESLDQADSLAVALYYAFILTNKIRPKSKPKLKPKSKKVKK